MERKSITTSYLELRNGQEIKEIKSAIVGLHIERLAVPCAAFNAFIYRAVGE
jgi:hypothetical protein